MDRAKAPVSYIRRISAFCCLNQCINGLKEENPMLKILHDGRRIIKLPEPHFAKIRLTFWAVLDSDAAHAASFHLLQTHLASAKMATLDGRRARGDARTSASTSAPGAFAGPMRCGGPGCLRAHLARAVGAGSRGHVSHRGRATQSGFGAFVRAAPLRRGGGWFGARQRSSGRAGRRHGRCHPEFFCRTEQGAPLPLARCPLPHWCE